MFSLNNKTKTTPAVQQKTAGTNFFRKTGERSFFGANENPTFFGKPIQAKLTVSTPDDPHEKEADAVAEKVMRINEPVAASPLQDKKEEKLQRKEEQEVQPKQEISGNKIQCKKELYEKLQTKEDTKNTRNNKHQEDIKIKNTEVGRDNVNGNISLNPSVVQQDNLTQNSVYLDRSLDSGGAGQGYSIQKAPAPGSCPANITFSTGNFPVHVPLCGITNVTANAVPANIPGLNWTLAAASATVASGTAISSNGDLTFGSSQTGGTLNVTADQPVATGGGTCSMNRNVSLHSHPAAISSTTVINPVSNAQNYGAVFDHSFTSADGLAPSLDNVPVGEEFSGVPNPTGTNHVIPNTPFGNFTLHTANLTNNANNNWFLNSGMLGGTHDTVTISKAMINVGRFLRSASNPSPALILPAGFTIVQGLYWFCRQAAVGSRWTRFANVNHVRTLRLDSTGTGVEFAVSVNGQENVDIYTGHPAIINARATVATIPSTRPTLKGKPAPVPSTTTIIADSRPAPLPGGHALRFSIHGPAHGCTVNATTGVVTAGSQTGSITVRVRDSAAANPNFDEVTVNIVPPPQPAPAQSGTPSPGSQQPLPNPTP